MQIKTLNQIYSYESRGNKALLMQGPCSISVDSQMSVWKIPGGNEISHSLHQVPSTLFYLSFTLSIMLKALQGSEFAGKTTYIASLHCTVNNWVKEVSSHQLIQALLPRSAPSSSVFSSSVGQVQAPECPHLCQGFIYPCYFMKQVSSPTALTESETNRASNKP